MSSRMSFGVPVLTLAALGVFVPRRAAWFALVPLALASLLTGIVMSLGTTGGLFRV